MLTPVTSSVAASAATVADTRSTVSVPQNVAAAPEAVQIANAVTKADAPPSLDELKHAVESINQSMKSLTQGLEFSIDEDSERVVVKVIVPETKEVIRQIPSEETLAIAKSLDQVIGKLIREVA